MGFVPRVILDDITGDRVRENVATYDAAGLTKGCILNQNTAFIFSIPQIGFSYY